MVNWNPLSLSSAQRDERDSNRLEKSRIKDSLLSSYVAFCVCV